MIEPNEVVHSERIIGHGWFVGEPPPEDWHPFPIPLEWVDHAPVEWLWPWTDEHWASWSDGKRQAMFELWDELIYQSHRDPKKYAYCLVLLERALGS